MKEPDFLFVLSQGFSARMVLHSNLVPQLQQSGASVAVCSPNAHEESMQALCAKKGVVLYAAPKVWLKPHEIYGTTRRYLLEDYVNNASLKAKHAYDLYASHTPWWLRLRSQAGGLFNRKAKNTFGLRQWMPALEENGLRHSGVRECLHTWKPKCVISTYPVHWLESLFVAEAKRLGIKTVGQLLSWDNILTKGIFPAVPEWFLTWGSVMEQEVFEHYGIDSSRVLKSGVPHFDIHRAAGLKIMAKEVLARIGLNADRPYLFFGMSATLFCPHEIDVVQWVVEQLRAGRWGDDLQLVIRPHPQNVRGAMADPKVVERVYGFVGDRVAIHEPPVNSDTLRWSVPEQDMWELSALLEGCALCLNSGSTLSIDAMMHNKPVVLPLFDAGWTLPWWRSVRRIADYPHYKKLLSYGAAQVVQNFESLSAALKAELENPSLLSKQRQQVIDEYIARPGESSAASAQALNHVLRAD